MSLRHDATGQTVRGTGMRRYLYESVFHDAAEHMNNLLASEDGTRVFTPAMAREARADMAARFASEQGRDGQPLSLDHPELSVPNFCETMVASLTATVSRHAKMPIRHSTMQQFRNRYIPRRDDSRASGMAMIQNQYRQFCDQLDTAGVLPISPYDPRWSIRGTIRSNPSRMHFLPEDVVRRVASVTDNGAVLLGTLHTDVDDAVQLQIATEKGAMQDVGPAFSDDDRMGLSALRFAMTDTEYETVRPHVLAGVTDEAGNLDPSKVMSRHAVNVAERVLRDLQAQGTEFTIERDRDAGQICAKLTNERLRVRLMDTRENDQYVGRVYDSETGAWSYVSSTVYADQRTLGAVATPEQVSQMVQLAQGRPVINVDDSTLVGTSEDRQKNYFVSGTNQIVTLGTVAGGINTDERVIGTDLVVRRVGGKNLPKYFSPKDPSQARTYLSDNFEAASRRLRDEIGAESLIEYVTEHEGADTETLPHGYLFSDDEMIAGIQEKYIETLTNDEVYLLRPGLTRDMFGSLSVEGQQNGTIAGGTKAENVRQHVNALIDEELGAPGRDEWDRLEGTFSPVGVARWMPSEQGVQKNLDDITAALRTLPEVRSEALEIQGDDYLTARVKDQSIVFDPERVLDEASFAPNSVRKFALDEVRHVLRQQVMIPRRVQMDDKGVIEFEAVKRGTDEKRDVVVTGTLGQVFEQDDNGAVVTQFAGTENYLFAPGYEARVREAKIIEGRIETLEERTVLKGYKEILGERIGREVSNLALVARTEVGNPTNLNGVYRRLYDTRHPVTFLDESVHQGVPRHIREAIIQTEARRVRYSNDLAQESTINAEYRAGKRRDNETLSENSRSVWDDLGHRNVAILSKEGDGYFDPIMTGGGTNQGIVRYLTSQAVVLADGTIAPGDMGSRAPLAEIGEARTMRFDPFDRQQMSMANLLTAAAVTKPTGTAMMTFGGWTADDPVVVSAEFAEEYAVEGADGTERRLRVGDKISDFHGNKGVISLIVDRERPFEEIDDPSLRTAQEVFLDNPDLHVVMSPFSAVSRFNGGTARDLMQNAQDLVLNGDVVPGALGEMSFIVTHMAVDSKTKVYDEQAIADGKGRKASSQLAWALQSQGCENILHEFYGGNVASALQVRETLDALGYDMADNGTLGVLTDETLHERNIVTTPAMKIRQVKAVKSQREAGIDTVQTPDIKAMRAEFAETIASQGGVLPIPFELTLASGEKTPMISRRNGQPRYGLPLLSPSLRSGHDLVDGTMSVHDYTQGYLDIYEASVWQDFCDDQASVGQLGMCAENVATKAAVAHNIAQNTYDAMSRQMTERLIEGRHNMFKESVMSSRLPHSATAVWTSDPRLDIDEVAMPASMMIGLGFDPEDDGLHYAMVWRDPILRDSGVRYLRVHRDDELTGIAIHPAMDACFDGDFDGDSVAVVALQSKRSHEEALKNLTVEANLLDIGKTFDPQKDALFADCEYPLNMQNSLDTKVAQHVRPELVEEWHTLTLRANEVHQEMQQNGYSEDIRNEQRNIVSDLSNYYRVGMGEEFGNAVLQFGSLEEHIVSVQHACIDTGAKGSVSKLQSYMRYLGAVQQQGDTLDCGRPLIERHDAEGVMFATAVKAFGTGVAGTFSQRGVKALRGEELSAVLELTAPVTQSILQSKHDPEEARHKYAALMGPARDLWRGYRITEGEDEWTTEYVEGNPVPVNRDEWVAQFERFYASSKGLNVPVNPELVTRVADALSDESGLMRNLENPDEMDYTALDELAYGGSREVLKKLAAEKACLYEGAAAVFAPVAVATADRRATDEPVLIPRDSVPTYQSRAKERPQVKRSVLAEKVSTHRATRSERGEPELF